MTSASSSLGGLPLEQLALYHAVDPLLQSSTFIFYGSITTANSTVSSSRIQAHIVSPAGVQSYPRITVSPAAPLYAAVNCLPREKQGDEVYRGLAVCLLKYFSELSVTVKDGLTVLSRSGKQGAAAKSPSSTRAMFDETHAAELANKMTKVEDRAIALEVVRDLKDAFGDRVIPWIDIDLVLPAGSIAPPPQNTRESVNLEPEHNSGQFVDRFGVYSSLVEALGEPVFLPTSKLKRAPSQPTNLSKSKVFSATQKESLRLSMCEVVDTEERYVGKMYDLVHHVAHQFRQKSREKVASSTSPSETELTRLFPPCLNEILDVNMGFLNSIRQILEDTEKNALGDISVDSTLDSSTFPRDPATGKRQDPMGILAFAHCLLDWFPRFSQPYAQYMHAHTSFTKVLADFLGDRDSSFSKRVQETGEQRMRSLLMEPVQRLPRYSLLIDTITGALPAIHPAVRPLLKARDMITDICSLDTDSPDSHPANEKRLQSLVADWPSSIAPVGRLATCADIYSLPVPYRIGSSASRREPGIMLVYGDYLVLLTKALDSQITARGVHADLDKPQSVDRENVPPTDLKFAHAMPIASVRATQSKCGRVLYLLPADNFVRSERSSSRKTLYAVELASTYEGKAGRLIEEITKARIESRFPEHFRERGKWSLHSPGGTIGDTKALVSVFEDEKGDVIIPRSSSSVKVTFDGASSDSSAGSASSGVEVLVNVSRAGSEKYKMEVEPVVGQNSNDTFAPADFIPVLAKRLHNILRPLNQAQNPSITDTILLSNFNILGVVADQILGTVKSSRVFRPPSPSKLLSNFWNGGQPKDQQSSGKLLPLSSSAANLPNIPPPKINYPQKDTTQAAPVEKSTSAAAGRINVTDETADQLKHLEQAFMAYILCIQSRRGNIVGRVLRSRDRADPSAVNELYNILLEDPGRIQTAAEATVDVLVVAFETFMNRAWKEKMGPLIPAQSLRLIQSKFDSMFPGDFEGFFRHFLTEMSPQSRRALTALVKLLAELLDASGNDGDRGALTAVFSEILTEEGDSREYISLIDRLVEDCDKFFDGSSGGHTSLESTLARGPSVDRSSRSRSQTATGSVSSNASSFRKRLGFGLNRERSKTESEGKFNSLIRSLSKTKGSGTESDSQNSLTVPKDSLLRSKSTDIDSRLPPVLRPMSRDRPLIQTLFSSMDDSLQRPDSSHSNASSNASAGDSNAGSRGASPKKKRRSSLSDLPSTSTADTTPFTPNKDIRRPITPVTNPNNNSSSRPGTSSSRVSPTRRLGPAIDFNNENSNIRRSPSRATPPPRLPSPTLRHTGSSRKENVPPSSERITTDEKPLNKKPSPPSGPPQSPRKRGDSVCQASAAPKSPVRKERQSNGAEPLASRTNSVPSSPTKGAKLKMQNPQKLRERVQNEKKALASVESGLQAELVSIASDISSNPKASPTKARPSSSSAHVKSMTSTTGSLSSSSASTTAALSNRVRNLENKLTTLTSSLSSRTAALEKDLENSLLVSERRAKKLDELYREASAENEALYERFNSELSRVTKDVKSGHGEESVGTQLKESLDEVARLRKENLRLKREVGGLRAQQEA